MKLGLTPGLATRGTNFDHESLRLIATTSTFQWNLRLESSPITTTGAGPYHILNHKKKGLYFA
jgi:hypothetical protein